LLNELWELVVAYFKQESVDPIKQVGRFVAWGLVGAIFIGVGLVLLAIGGLRALQSDPAIRTHLRGNWSWAPYGAVAAVSLAVAGLSVSRIFKVPSREDT
jgi:uncharacterized membrane protein YidH (DUF202 family)